MLKERERGKEEKKSDVGMYHYHHSSSLNSY